MFGLLQTKRQKVNILVTGSGSLLGQGIIKSLEISKLKCKLFSTDYFPSAVGLYWAQKSFLLPDFWACPRTPPRHPLENGEEHGSEGVI